MLQHSCGRPAGGARHRPGRGAATSASLPRCPGVHALLVCHSCLFPRPEVIWSTCLLRSVSPLGCRLGQDGACWPARRPVPLAQGPVLGRAHATLAQGEGERASDPGSGEGAAEAGRTTCSQEGPGQRLRARPTEGSTQGPRPGLGGGRGPPHPAAQAREGRPGPLLPGLASSGLFPSCAVSPHSSGPSTPLLLLAAPLSPRPRLDPQGCAVLALPRRPRSLTRATVPPRGSGPSPRLGALS